MPAPDDATAPAPVDRRTAAHYAWGQGCDGWRLLADPALSVTEERMPPGASESRHLHRVARQFFYVLEGELTFELAGREHRLVAGQGLEVPPPLPHRVFNRSAADARFLVVSSPATANDREPAAGAP